ncbi:hypothetical protein PCASD_23971 [Puccinia coronata f. sp. avenae]|uniref:Uncharacterized protein n=1 Tax=Puccinia coronata f. sp. avenae TaxID=200324 RepID=A0A2N5RX74_9BASI|nr:hypothetical protein PCASD_23971 [Puccinia coronata f. sp. avenae]
MLGSDRILTKMPATGSQSRESTASTRCAQPHGGFQAADGDATCNWLGHPIGPTLWSRDDREVSKSMLHTSSTADRCGTACRSWLRHGLEADPSSSVNQRVAWSFTHVKEVG